MLKALVTDHWFDGMGKMLAQILSARSERRSNVSLPRSCVKSFNMSSACERLWDSYVLGLNWSFDRWMRTGESFGRKACSYFYDQKPGDIRGVIGYTCGGLEVYKVCNQHNFRAIHCQIDPGLSFYDEKDREWEMHPEAEARPVPVPDAFRMRLQHEWKLADAIVVNSQYSKISLMSAGVPEGKIRVIPLVVSGFASRVKPRKISSATTKVLWVGNISLIKGFYYFAEAAQKLSERGFQFTAAGNCALTPSYAARISRHIQFVGHLTRPELEEYYQSADILVFPTLSDGFGAVQLEAMSRGIPVIATANCGDVVRNGENGFKIPIRCSDSIIDSLLRIHKDRSLYYSLSHGALLTTEKYTEQSFATELIRLLNEKGKGVRAQECT